MCAITEELKKKVWEKGREVNGYDPNKIRQDACGAWIRYDKYGDRSSIFGWEIDHIYPRSVLREKKVIEEDIDALENLRPLNWLNNDAKGIDYPAYHARVKADGNKSHAHSRRNIP